MSTMERELMSLLRQATMAMRAATRHALADLDLTPVQSTVLHMIAAAPGSSSAELARRTRVTPQTMHKLIANLEDRGLLALQHRPGHGRILDAHLTAAGGRLLAEADSRTQAIENRMSAGLDRERRQELADLLRHCIAALDMSPEDRAESPTGTPQRKARTDRRHGGH